MDILNGFITSSLYLTEMLFNIITDWISSTTKSSSPDPPDPGVIQNTLRENKEQYTEFCDRMIRAVHGKSRYSDKAVNTLFGALVSPSQEAFALLLYINGYSNWCWMHNDSGVSSKGSESDGCPGYLYTARSSELTSRNGGWSGLGIKKYNDLYEKVIADRHADGEAFDKMYMEHWKVISKGKHKRKRDNNVGHLRGIEVRDDLADLMRALDGTEYEAAAVVQQQEEV